MAVSLAETGSTHSTLNPTAGVFTANLTIGAKGGAVGGGVGGWTQTGNSEGFRAGARAGAISGGLFAGADTLSTVANFGKTGQILTRSTAGGLASEANGGRFADGFKTQLGFSVASASYRYAAGASALSRQASNTNVFGEMMPDGAGTASPCFFTCEGGATMSFVNKWLPFGRATGWVHDWTTGTSPVGKATVFIEGIGTMVPRTASNVALADFVSGSLLGDAYNVATMVPSYLVTVGAAIDESGATAYLPPR